MKCVMKRHSEHEPSHAMHFARKASARRLDVAGRHHVRALPVSSHPEIEEEIRATEGGLNTELIHAEPPRPPAKPIVSIGGRDIDHEKAA